MTGKYLHVFRNGIRNSYYSIEYWDKNNKKFRFFLDYIIINDENQKADAIEIKGREALSQNIVKNFKVFKSTKKKCMENIKLNFVKHKLIKLALLNLYTK